MSFFKRTYQQASWRTRRQTVGAFLVGLVCVSMVGALYLSVTSQAAILGREIRDLEREISINKQTNADLNTKLAGLLSSDAIAERSRKLGFRRADASETYYMVVSGYDGALPVSLTGATNDASDFSNLPAAYTQSLFDWISERMRGAR
ncbi:MAG: hypothetical protein L3J16_00905 [Anaerolineales bacterium]|nr:hypothetical protein [Anaerolineales bacterium]